MPDGGWLLGILATIILGGGSAWMTYMMSLMASHTVQVDNLRLQVGQLVQQVNIHEFKLNTIDIRLQRIEEKMDRAILCLERKRGASLKEP